MRGFVAPAAPIAVRVAALVELGHLFADTRDGIVSDLMAEGTGRREALRLAHVRLAEAKPVTYGRLVFEGLAEAERAE